jgi:trigger factor
VKVTKEKIENSQAYLKIEMETAETDVALDQAYKTLVKKANIPGFRKGKAPRNIVEAYIGKDALFQEAVNAMIPEAYDKAIQEQQLQPIDQPLVEIENYNPVTYKAVVPLAPTATLGDYTTIKILPESVSVNEEQVDRVIDNLRHQNGTWEPAERPIAVHDMITLDVKSESEGKTFLNKDGMQYEVEEGYNFPAPGFSEQLKGMTRNEEKEFTLKMPDAWAQKDFAGKEVNFKIKVTEIKQEKLPEVNDEFAKTVSSECSDVRSLRERIKSDLTAREEERNKFEYEDKVIEGLLAISKLEYPPTVIDHEIDRLLNQQLQYLQMSGVNIEEYIKQIQKSPEQMRDEIKPRAEKRVRQSLVMEKFGEQEKIEVSPDEVKAEIDNLLKGVPEDKQTEMRGQFEASSDSVRKVLIIRKALQKLVESAKTDVPAPKLDEVNTSDIKVETIKADDVKSPDAAAVEDATKEIGKSESGTRRPRTKSKPKDKEVKDE